MKSPNIILNELKEISPLIAEIKNKNIYSVVPDYFNNLAENILQRINSDNKLISFSLVTPYKVKEGYFENFSENVLQKIRSQQKTLNEVTDELNGIAPLLNTISKTPLFSVPKGYFENLEVLPNQSLKPQVKVISIVKKFTRYAVAAVIAALMVVAFYLITGKEQKKSAVQALNIKSAIKDLRDEEIIEFLSTHSSSGKTTTVSSDKNIPASKINESLKQMKEEDIQQYLQENQEPAEIEVDI